MKKPKIDTANGDIRLPEAVIQHIQSFLNGKEAAQTSIISRSWYNAWSTRPKLDFDQHRFGIYYRSHADVKRFLESARKTIRRYEESNLRVESFKLCIDRRQRDNCMVGDELTAKALKLGATKLFSSGCLGYPNSPITLNANQFRNVKFLWLECLSIDPVFSDDSSCEFPCLNVLEFHNCFSKQGIRIHSPSLECINFAHNKIWTAVFDVPNIRKFTFLGYNTLPSLAFERVSRDWASELSVEWKGSYFRTSWFLDLEKFLEELNQSKISLSFEIGSAERVMFDYARNIPGLPKPVVENLTLKLHRKYITGDSAILKCLFGSCEPKFITQYWEDLLRRGWGWRLDDYFLKLLCNTLMLEVSENGNVSRLPGLEEVNVECFEETRARWRPLSLKTLLYSSISLENKQLIRFRLRWR